MFKALGLILAGYTIWAAYEGRVYAKAGGFKGGRYVVKAQEPGYFWVVIAIYGALSIALVTVF
jgi:hypothetical protein